MSRLIYFASQNPNKLREIRAMSLSDIRPLSELGHHSELEETGLTLEANAVQKARFVYDRFGVNCFAEDTGLEVEALMGEPGVKSARYAGEDKNAEENVKLLLHKLRQTDVRKARFRTVIALILDGREHLFEGVLEGHIAKQAQGHGGFGYDPVFVPLGCTQTLAQMTAREKNSLSHRGKAVHAMVRFLDTKGTEI